MVTGIRPSGFKSQLFIPWIISCKDAICSPSHGKDQENGPTYPQRDEEFLFFFFLMAALGLSCCVHAFSSCGERGLFFVAVRGLLIAVASLVAQHGL